MNLVIEDEFKVRETRLHELGLQHPVLVAPNSKTALALLTVKQIPEYDSIWWDFDLGLREDKTDDSSYSAAQWLAEAVFHDLIEAEDIPLCFVHTSNPVGRENLKATFNRWNIRYKEVFLS